MILNPFFAEAPLFVGVRKNCCKAYLPAGICDLAASLADCSRKPVSMGFTVLTDRVVGSCMARVGEKLTVQTNDFSHDEGNVDLSLLCLARFVLRDKREQIGMVDVEVDSVLSNKENLCGRCCCPLQKARIKRSTTLTLIGKAWIVLSKDINLMQHKTF